MSKIKIDDIRRAAIEHNWTLISNEYINLNTDLEFKCSEGHNVYLPYKKVRDRWECPICEQNKYYNFNTDVAPKKHGVERIIGLDQATHRTGYSIFDDGELIYADLFEATEEEEITRDIEIRNWLIQLIQKYKPDIIGMEDIQLQQFNNKMIGVTTYRTLARLQGILMAACKEQGVEYVLCHQATWRSDCGVKGRTRTDKKESMQRLVKEWFDISVSDDVADAIGIGKYTVDHHTKKVEMFNWE